MSGTVKPIGTIRPEDAMTTPIDWEELTPEKRKLIGAMLDTYLNWAQSVPEIARMTEK